MKIAIFGNIHKPQALEKLRSVLSILQKRKVAVLLDKELYHFISSEITLDTNVSTIDGDDFSADYALSIGGDGTLLKAASKVLKKDIPILGINFGRLGFLADVDSDSTEKAIDELLAGNMLIKERTVLQFQIGETIDYALNEVVVLKRDSSSLIHIHAEVNGELLNTYQADGLIVATPTGSTAYSMSVGGPIVVPQANNFIISPVAPHSLTMRPLVIPDRWTITLQVESRNHNFLVSLDGHSKIYEDSEKMYIRKAPYSIKLVKQQGHTFFNTLKNKLMWGVDTRV
jgi:NAD+ kinase